MINEFNQKLENIVQQFELQINEEDLRICSIAGIDNMLSFETKVNYLCEFFNTKHLELSSVI